MKKLKVFVDTDIILDVLLERDVFFEYGAAIFEMSAKGKIDLYASVLSISNISYIIRKEIKNVKKVKEYIKDLMDIVRTVSVNEGTVRKALETDFSDIEDSIQYTAAKESGMDCLVTRNVKDYKTSTLRVYGSKEFTEKHQII